MDGFCEVEVNPLGPVQEKLAPVVVVVAFKVKASPSHITLEPLITNFGTGAPLRQVALLNAFRMAAPGNGPKPRLRLMAPLLWQ